MKEYSVIGMCQIYNESLRCDRISPSFFNEVVSFYKGLCDSIIFLDDCSTDNTYDQIRSLLREDDILLKNERNSWSNNEEVKNKIKLYDQVKQLNPDFIISFDFDEILPLYFDRKYLEVLINHLKKNNLKALQFEWVSLWFSEGYYRTDQLGRISPPRMWLYHVDDKILFQEGLHNILWPQSISENNSLMTGLPLLHYSSVNFDNLIDKLLYYRRQTGSIDNLLQLFKSQPCLLKTKDGWFNGRKINRLNIEEEIFHIAELQKMILDRMGH